MTGTNRIYPLVLLGAVYLALTGCGPGTPPVAETPPPVVTVSQPIEQEITDYAQFTGRTEAVQTQEVRARVRGELLKVHFEDGAIVKAGAPLFDIDPRPYKAALAAAESMKANAQASYRQAATEYERTRRLARSAAASASELEMWKGKQGIAAAEIKHAEAEIEKANLDLTYTKITAGITGRISRPLVTQGNMVNAGGGETLLTTIVTVDPMYVEFDVDQGTLLRFQEMAREQGLTRTPEEGLKQAKVRFSMGLDDQDQFPYQGVLDFAENKVDPATSTIHVRGVLPNKDRRLTPGLFARVRVPVSEKYKALLVTDRALGTDQGQKYLLVVNDQNKVEFRPVTPGRQEGDLRVFRPGAGLKRGEWVIVNGIQRVRPGIEVKPERVPMPTRPRAGAEPGK
jgi:membrane fusion protein, multidrug efflux system